MARAVQVVPGSRVRISPKWVGLSLTLLAAALAVSRVGGSGGDSTRLATVRARPDPVQDYDTSETDAAIRGVGNKIWATDAYRREMVQSSLLWLVAVPLLAAAFFCARGVCSPHKLDDDGYPRKPSRYAPYARCSSYGSAAAAAVAPAEIVGDSNYDDGDGEALPAASAVIDLDGDELVI